MRPLHIQEPEGERFELALDQFEAGDFFVFRGIGLCLRPEFVEVRVPSSCEIENTTEVRARGDLELAERSIEYLEEASPRARRLVGSRSKRFVLLYDYGTGGIEICDYAAGALTWRPGYPRLSD